jgi:septum formation protein
MIYLASTSPRRAGLLRDAGYAFEQVDPAFDDSGVDLHTAATPRAAEALAYLKAASVADRAAMLGEPGVIVGSDTIVTLGNRQYGKPDDLDHARAMLGELTGRTHQVVTAVALIETPRALADADDDAADRLPRQVLFHAVASVTIGRLDDADFEAYLASGQWRGKAGGYNLAELRDHWPFEIDGDPTTVVGLPMRALGRHLQDFAASDR